MGKSFEDCVIEGTLSVKENLRIYKEEDIYGRYSYGLIPQKQPVAILLGGQPASGKTTLRKKILQEYETKGGIAIVEGDALRKHHPRFDEYNLENDKLSAAYTAKDSGRWSERLIEDHARNRHNMIIETTLKNRTEVSGMVERLKAAGYDVQVKVFVVSYDKSLLGCYARYERQKLEDGAGRFVPDHILKDAYVGMPETLQALKEQDICSCIQLYTREEVLFEGDYRQTDIVALVQQERCRAYTSEEIRFLRNGWNDVGEKMLARGAGKEEFAEISDRMERHIGAMIKEGVAKENVHVMIDMHRDFNRQSVRNISISQGLSM